MSTSTLLLIGLAATTGVVAPNAAHAAPEPVSISRTCDDAPRDRFTDVPRGDTHARGIDCIGWWGITQGSGKGRYQPSGTVTRGQMASFVARTITLSGGRLPVSPPNAFRDDTGSPHERAIDQLAALGVVSGVGPKRYAPDRAVTRAQMASFLARAWEARTGGTLPTGSNRFRDDEGDVHERNIDRVAAAGLTGGTGRHTFGPGEHVTRAQMATFLSRTLAKLAADGHGRTRPADPVPHPRAAPRPAPTPPRSSGPGSMPDGTFRNCTEARERGAAPVLRGDPGFHPRLDRDNDGIGCE